MMSSATIVSHCNYDLHASFKWKIRHEIPLRKATFWFEVQLHNELYENHLAGKVSSNFLLGV